MPRKKISEHKAKQLVHKALDAPYQGWGINTHQPLDKQLALIPRGIQRFVVKVDQGVKGRFKKGLVLLDVSRKQLPSTIKSLGKKGYYHFIIEPQFSHNPADERYLSLHIDRSGLTVNYTARGGVDVESHAATMCHEQLSQKTRKTDWHTLARKTGFSPAQPQKLAELFTENYMTLLEINPYIAKGDTLRILDVAVEVDDAGAFFTDAWSEHDFRGGQAKTQEEQTVLDLAAKSPASFKLDVINPNGSVFVLLSGGGASIVVADEVYSQGHGDLLGNYGEYSGNPNTEETYIYTKAVLNLLLKSRAPQKTLIIGGGVANFTDIANTFAGIITALDDVADELKQQRVKVFVRRGGPRQDVGLAKIEAALKRIGIFGAVRNPQTPLPTIVSEALKELDL